LCNCLILIVIYKGLKTAFMQHKMFNFMAPFDNTDQKKTKNLLAKTFSIAQTSRPALRPNQPPIQWGLGGFFPQGQSNWSMRLTTLHLVLCLRMSVAIPCSPCMPLWHAQGNFTFENNGSAMQTNRHLLLDSRITTECHNKTTVLSDDAYS